MANIGCMSALLIPGNRAALAFKLASQPQTDDTRFQPNQITDPKFVRLLGQCHSLGMNIRALSCDIDGVNIEIIGALPVKFQR